MLTSTCPWWTATARSIPIGCCALRLSSAHRRAVPGPGQRQSHSGRRPLCGVPVAVARSVDRPVRYITLADNTSTTKLKGKQLCASCVIMMAGRTMLKMKLPREKKKRLAHRNSWKNVLMEIICAMPVNPRPTGGGLFRAPPPSGFLEISSKPMQVSPPNLQYPLSQHFYTLC